MKKKQIQHISGWSFYKNQQQDKTLFGKLKRTQSQTLPKSKKKIKKKQNPQKSIIDEIRIQQITQKVQQQKLQVLQTIQQKPKLKPQSPKKSPITILDQKQYKIKIQQEQQKQTPNQINERRFSPKKQKTKRQHLQLQGYCPILDISKQISTKKKHLNECYDVLFLLQVVSQKLRAQTFEGKYMNHQEKMECLFPILFGPLNNANIFGPAQKQRILFLNGNKIISHRDQLSLNKSTKNK